MKEAGILDRDLLAVHRTQDISNGQIVVARIEDEVTVKRFHRENNRVHLMPENADYDPIVIDVDTTQLHIEGRGVGVIRHYG